MNKSFKITKWFLFIALLSTALFAQEPDRFNIFDSKIDIHNESKENIYVAAYYQKSLFNFKCKRSTDVYEILPNEMLKIDRPDRKFFYDREIIFSMNKDDLTYRLSEDEYRLLEHTDIGNLEGDRFYLISRNDILYGYNYLDWKILEPFKDFLEKATYPIIEKIIKEVSHGKHSNDVATVTLEPVVSKGESDFVIKRHSKIRKILSEKIGFNFDKVPNIAFSFSGGGYRAMIATLGALEAAKKEGLLDLITYFSSLSGSTFLIAPWISSGLSLKNYRKILINKVSTDLLKTDINVERFIKRLITKKLFGQGISLTDLFGEIVQSKFYDGISISENETLSNSRQYIYTASYPMPIYNAVDFYNEYNFYEFNPFDVKSFLTESFVPSWSFGRKFVNGESTNFAPEIELSNLNAICGSTYSITVKELFENEFSKILNDKKFSGILDFILDSDIGDARPIKDEHFNTVYGLEASEFKNIEKTTFLDAGIFQNLSVPPLLVPERNIDLIVVFDYSRTPNYGKKLTDLKKYVNKKGLKFPPINYDGLDERSASIFRDVDDPSVPTIIYIPLKKDPDYSDSFDPNNDDCYRSFNTVYTKEQFNELRGGAAFSLLKNKDLIYNEILKIMKEKNI